MEPGLQLGGRWEPWVGATRALCMACSTLGLLSAETNKQKSIKDLCKTGILSD